jgi:two-component system CheB/CheR fusion protein
VSEPGPAFEALLAHVKNHRGFDFTGYKRSSLLRRVERRMAQVGVDDHAAYLDHLEVHADEFTALFNAVLINVTDFFRDPEAWDHLRADVLPGLLAAKPPTEPVRVWSAGCASGEEAYTLAMVLAEMLGPAEFRDRVKIYATDVDEDALGHARQGGYSTREVRSVPPELLERYFEPTGGRYAFRKDLRRSVIFGRNDLVQDAPISRLDLLVCRNTLMYFTAETQARILGRFHFALDPAGALFLGKAEMLLSHSALFLPVDLKRRIFTRAPRPVPAGNSLFPEPRCPGCGRAERARRPACRGGARRAGRPGGRHRRGGGRRGEPAGGARLRVSARDVGRPFRDLDLSYRPLELRRHLEIAQAERRTVRVPDVAFHRGAEVLALEVQISPLAGPGGEVLGVGIAFHDTTEARRLQDELEQANRQLETAYEELQSTNEELETTNEELQSTVEELETTNEELQSTNEELETMNEELRSTNDELQTINEELQDRTGQLDRANDFLEAILTSLRSGVVVLDAQMQVRVWNRQAQELWGLRPDEAVGQHFLNLDIGLPTDRSAADPQHARPTDGPAGGRASRGQPARAPDRRPRAGQRAARPRRRRRRHDPHDGGRRRRGRRRGGRGRAGAGRGAGGAGD